MSKSAFLIIAERILKQQKRPMSAIEIVESAHGQKLFDDSFSGKTPSQTMKSKLSVNIRRKGEESIFVRTAPGKFYLRSLLQNDDTVYNALPIHKPKSKEQTLVFKADVLNELDRFQGIMTKGRKKLLKKILNRDNCTHIPRLEAELVEDHKQVLTYVMITKGNQVLAFKRGNYNRVEDYLKGSHCIGFGGHVTLNDSDNLFDHNLAMSVSTCAIREIQEELKLPKQDILKLNSKNGLTCVGLLNDDSSKVGQRHFAVLYKYEVSNHSSWKNPERGEKSITQLRWLRADNLNTHIRHFEYWSQLCLREYFKNIIQSAPTYLVNRRKKLKSSNIVCIVGPVGSGKSEATDAFVNNHNHYAIGTGEILAKLMKIPPVPVTQREEFQAKAKRFIKHPTGPKRLASAISKIARSTSTKKILIDGIRQRSTLTELISLLGPDKLSIIYVHTLFDQAYNFYREREGQDATIFDFLKVRNAVVEQEVEGLINIADAVLYNWSGKVKFQNAVKGLVNDLYN